MTVYNFIFSNKLKHRLTRHLALWAFFCLYFFIVNFSPTSAADFSNFKTYTIAFQKLIYIPVSILSAYITAYFLLPRYLLKEKYFRFIILLTGLSVVNLVNAFWLTKLYALLTLKLPFDELPIQIRVFWPIIYGLGLSTSAGVFAGIVRLLKIHYLKQKENERLEKLKITTELEIIKTHFHPHFLSDALQNISHLIRNRSAQSADAILKLADLLSYILYENDKERVPLEQEMELVHTYLELEKTFYDDSIIIDLKEPADLNVINIAPLIIVSLVQHCCEQSLLSLQQKLIVDIEIKAEAGQLIFLLNCNGYYESIIRISQQNSSLSQVLKRVQALYPNRHSIETHLDSGVFSLKLFLDTWNPTLKTNVEAKKKIVYEPA